MARISDQGTTNVVLPHCSVRNEYVCPIFQLELRNNVLLQCMGMVALPRPMKVAVLLHHRRSAFHSIASGNGTYSLSLSMILREREIEIESNETWGSMLTSLQHQRTAKFD